MSRDWLFNVAAIDQIFYRLKYRIFCGLGIGIPLVFALSPITADASFGHIMHITVSHISKAAPQLCGGSPRCHTNYISTPAIHQSHALDCEATALQAALAAKGTSISQDTILAEIGSDLRAANVSHGNVLNWGDPYQTFVGNVNGSERAVTGYGVYYPPIVSAAQQAGDHAIGGEGWSATDVYAHLSAGDPVIVWADAKLKPVAMRTWTAWDGRRIHYSLDEHAITLTGLDVQKKTVTFMDPRVGRFSTISAQQFEAFWSSFGNMAVVVQ